MARQSRTSNKLPVAASRAVSDSEKSSQAIIPANQASDAALLALAEELGRLAARLQCKPTRQGYSLPELLFGAAATALFWILVSRWLCWIPR